MIILLIIEFKLLYIMYLKDIFKSIFIFNNFVGYDNYESVFVMFLNVRLGFLKLIYIWYIDYCRVFIVFRVYIVFFMCLFILI